MLIIGLLVAAFPIYWGYERFIATNESQPDSDAAEKRSDFLAVADDYAATLFAEGRWQEAVKAYRVVRERYLEANDGVYDEAAATLLFNEAASEMNRGRSDIAQTLLLELQVEAPSYRPEEIMELVRETADRAQTDRYDYLAAEASAAFDEGNWTLALQRHQELLVHLRSMGYSEADDLVSQTMYDHAMAYSNGAQYADAERILSGIKAGNPDYDPARVDEQHQRIIAILKDQ